MSLEIGFEIKKIGIKKKVCQEYFGTVMQSERTMSLHKVVCAPTLCTNYLIHIHN